MLHERNTRLTNRAPVFTCPAGSIRNVLFHTCYQKIADALICGGSVAMPSQLHLHQLRPFEGSDEPESTCRIGAMHG